MCAPMFLAAVLDHWWSIININGIDFLIMTMASGSGVDIEFHILITHAATSFLQSAPAQGPPWKCNRVHDGGNCTTRAHACSSCI